MQYHGQGPRYAEGIGMDITPIYELRTRLKTAVIAGTNLLSEDFRLKRAVEGIQPLLPASPVFAKLGQLCEALLTPEKEGKEGLLLDAITLVDAVICTQGTVAVQGETEPIAAGSYGTAVTNAPYSLVKTLLDALTSSGGGRYTYVLETHRDRPELFSDYRVKAAMVQALDAPYAELAAKVEEWLSQDGEGIVPLLKKGFDPKGKKGMVRRVQVMDAVAGEKENDFYLAMLAEAEKEVRQALIYALRHSEENIDRLMDMVKTEKGNAKRVVYYALASRRETQVGSFFEKLMEKKPADVAEYLEQSGTDWSAELTARGCRELLLPWMGKTAAADSIPAEQTELVLKYICSLPYKHGACIREIYRIAASIGEGLDAPVAADQKRKYSFQRAVSCALGRALLYRPDKELCELALKLYEQSIGTGAEADYFEPALTAKLLTEEDCCPWIRKQMEKGTLFRKKTKASVIEGIETVVGYLYYDEDRKENMLRENGQTIHPVTGQVSFFVQPVKQRIQGSFTELLMELGSQKLDRVLGNLIRPEDTEYRELLLEYFYNRALTVGDNRSYATLLAEHGGTKCEGLAVHYFRSKGTVERWHLSLYVNYLPGDGKAKAEEVKRVFDLVKRGKLKGKNLTQEWMDSYADSLL